MGNKMSDYVEELKIVGDLKNIKQARGGDL